MPTYRWIGLTSAIPTERQGSIPMSSLMVSRGSEALPSLTCNLFSSVYVWTQLFCTPALFFWSVSENFHFVALFTVLPASRVSLLSWRELFAHGHAHLGSQRPLGFFHRSESCKFISEPNPVLIPFPSITSGCLLFYPLLPCVWVVMFFFVCLFCNNLCSRTPLAFS